MRPVRPPIVPSRHKPQIVTSPRIERLRLDGDVEGFWREVREDGAPLVEVADEPGYALLTFVWRGDVKTRDVLVVPNKLFDRTDPSGSLLRRVAGTDVWHLSYRLPSDFRCSYQFCVDEQGTREPDDEYWLALWRQGRSDPYGVEAKPGYSVVSLPQAPPQPWLEPREGVARGSVGRHRFRSAILDNDRRLWTYRLPGAEASSGLLILLDGRDWFEPALIATIMDNMMADGRIPLLSVVGVDSLDPDTRARELCPNDDFVEFLTTELLDWAKRRLPIGDRPERTILSGQSFGGLAALYAGLRAPERFDAIVAQSPSLWWSPDGRDHRETAWLSGELAAAERLPRIHVTAGTYEAAIVEQTRQLTETLTSRGHAASYTEFTGGHDFACWRGHLSDGLITVTQPDSA